jgi:hypothetical protein
MLPRLLDYIRKRRRTFEVPMPKINALRFAMIGASTGRGRDRPKANLRKFRGYSNDCQNQKYEAISGGFLADDAVPCEPVSEDKFPAEQGKYSDLGRKWPAPDAKRSVKSARFQ